MTTPPDHILALLEVEIYDGVRRPFPPEMMIPEESEEGATTPHPPPNDLG